VRAVAPADRSKPERFCDILVLPANVKRCAAGDTLDLYIAKKSSDGERAVAG